MNSTFPDSPSPEAGLAVAPELAALARTSPKDINFRYLRSAAEFLGIPSSLIPGTPSSLANALGPVPPQASSSAITSVVPARPIRTAGKGKLATPVITTISDHEDAGNDVDELDTSPVHDRSKKRRRTGKSHHSDDNDDADDNDQEASVIIVKQEKGEKTQTASLVSSPFFFL